MMHFCLSMKHMHCIRFICTHLRMRSFQKHFLKERSNLTIHVSNVITRICHKLHFDACFFWLNVLQYPTSLFISNLHLLLDYYLLNIVRGMVNLQAVISSGTLPILCRQWMGAFIIEYQIYNMIMRSRRSLLAVRIICNNE